MRILVFIHDIKTKTAIKNTSEAIIEELKKLGNQVEVYMFGHNDHIGILPDVILTIHCPEALKFTENWGVPRLAYHGDIAPINRKTYFDNFELFNGKKPTLRNKIGQWLETKRFEKEDWETMKKVNVIANVTACNADYYTKKGHRNSIYAGNTWR